MKKKKRSYTVYLGGELFSLKHLIGNAWLAEAIYEKSQGRFRCLLPQDFAELRGRSGRAVRDTSFRALVACDLALLSFDGSDIDSGTVVEFMYAKFADVPTVLLRTDIRNGRDHREEPWNLMASYFPRTASVIVPSLGNYRGALLRRQRRRLDPVLHLAGQQSSAAAQLVWEQVATQCVRAFDRVLAMPPVMPKHLREEAYQWLALAPALRGKERELRREFERHLERKVERDLL
jgi:nucleoside 2-deoxyribosyltransferase